MPVILVLEDDRSLAHLIREMLRPEGQEILLACSNAEARRYWQARGSHIGLVIADHRLVGKARGTEFAYEVQISSSATKILYMTTSAHELTQDPKFVHGTPILTKPFLGDEVRDRVGQLLQPKLTVPQTLLEHSRK